MGDIFYLVHAFFPQYFVALDTDGADVFSGAYAAKFLAVEKALLLRTRQYDIAAPVADSAFWYAETSGKFIQACALESKNPRFVAQ